MVIDISLSNGESIFANVTNPRTLSWTEDLLPALHEPGLRFEDVTPKEWVQRLRSSNPDPKANPPIKLVEFFASKYDRDEVAPPKAFATENACLLSTTLAAAPVLEQAFVDKFMEYILRSGGKSTAEPKKKTAVIIAGPRGTGKTTTGLAVSKWLSVPFIEGDTLYTQACVEKMRDGAALSDDDRRAWLSRICSHSQGTVVDSGYASVVVSCSALKQFYRSHLRQGFARSGINTVFMHLQVDAQILVRRVEAQTEHYLGAGVVQGQLDMPEDAAADEADVVPVDAEADEKDVLEEVKWLLGKLMA